MKNLNNPEIWYVTGSQHLYGEETLKQVAEDSQKIVEALNRSERVPLKVVFKPVLTTPEEIRQLCLEANIAALCAGLILWMHTFSPSKMWIGGLCALRKPFLHLHTQFNRDLPWSEIDMDFMNLNQSAHGDREAGFIHTRLRLNRKVVVGHWSDTEVEERISAWMRSARAWHDLQGAKFARFGDNMRQVAVTEGDKVSAEARLGYSVNGYGVGDLVKYVNDVSDADITRLCAEYEERYKVARELRKGGARHASLRDGARIELGLRGFLQAGDFKGFTTTFEDLHGLKQLPGLAVQRLMADGFGFGAEGDWKTCALLRAMKVIAVDLKGGTSFMEDYTYHLHPDGHQVSVRTCSKSVSRLQTANLHWKSIRSGSVARKTRCASCSMLPPEVQSTLPLWILAIASACSSTKSTSSSQRSRCRSSRSRVPCGSVGLASRLPARHGFMPVGRTTPVSVTRSPQSTWKTLRKSQA
jgi:L-arabinose isomerase